MILVVSKCLCVASDKITTYDISNIGVKGMTSLNATAKLADNYLFLIPKLLIQKYLRKCPVKFYEVNGRRDIGNVTVEILLQTTSLGSYFGEKMVHVSLELNLAHKSNQISFIG